MKTIYTALWIALFAALVTVGSASAVGVTYGDNELSLTEYAKAPPKNNLSKSTPLMHTGISW